MIEEPLSEFMDELGLCGCGIPEDVVMLYGGALRAMKDRSAQRYAPGSPQPFEGMDDTARYALLYVLDNHDLIEHGGNVGGAWLTDKGDDLLTRIEAWASQEKEDE